MPRIPPLFFATSLALGFAFAGAFPIDSRAQGAKPGIANPGQEAGASLNDFGNWLGTPMQWNVTWTDYNQFTWEQEVGAFNSYLNTDRLNMWKTDGRAITISIPLVMYNETLATAASGADDASWAAIGAALVAHGHGGVDLPIVLRLGWEFNGSWYAWKAKSDIPSFVAAWRRIVAILRATPNSHFLIEWCPSLTGNKINPIDPAYPGDDVVDIIGLDVYNKPKYMPTPYNSTPQLSWQYNLSHSNNGLSLNWFTAFAAKHHKPMSMAEWGQNIDDPYFITQMAAWIAQQNMLYWVYFSTSLGTYSLDLNPNSKAAFYAAFSGSTPLKVQVTLVGTTIYRGP